jgi:hypothetical protein
MFPSLDYEQKIVEYFNTLRSNLRAQPLFLGATYSGSGGPPGGFIGYLPQTKVSYDAIESSSNYVPFSGASLLDNLNHIRYKIDQVAKQQLTFTIPGANIASGDQGVKLIRQYAVCSGILDSVIATVGTAPTGSAIRVDVLKNGTTVFNSPEYIEIGTTEYYEESSENFSVTTFSETDYFQIELVQGDSAATDLTVHVRYHYDI